MPANADKIGENSTIAEHIRLRRPTIQTEPISFYIDHPPPPPPPPQQHISSLTQSTLCKSSISSLFLSTFSTTTTTTTHETATTGKKKNFTSSTFRGLGCAAASPRVSVPAVIRTSAEWEEAEKVGKTKQKNKNKNKKKSKTTHEQEQEHGQGVALMANNSLPPPPFQPSLSRCSSSSSSASDVVWCSPGVGFGGGADDATPVDCVLTRRNLASRGKIDREDKFNHRERLFPARRGTNPEHISDFDSAFGPTHSESDVFGSRYCRNVRHRSPEALAEILMLQSGLLMGGRLASRDQFRDWRLNIDGMTYEELLALGDRIGYVSTGLKENEVSRYLRKIKGAMSSNFSKGKESKCSICQEEFEADDEMGKLNCGHTHHMDCIKQWLLQKNACPVCKSEVVARR